MSLGLYFKVSPRWISRSL